MGVFLVFAVVIGLALGVGWAMWLIVGQMGKGPKAADSAGEAGEKGL